MSDVDFQIIELEYKQSSLLFQRGFELLMSLIKWTIIINVTTMLGLGIGIGLEAVKSLKLCFVFMALIGLFGSLSMLFVHRRVVFYLRQLMERAGELEAQFGGRIFSRAQEIENQSRNDVVRIYPVSLSLYPAFAFAWALLFYAVLTR